MNKKLIQLANELIKYDQVKISISFDTFISLETTFNNFNNLTLKRWKKYAKEFGLKIKSWTCFAHEEQLHITLRFT